MENFNPFLPTGIGNPLSSSGLGVLGAAISATVSLALATIALNVLCRRRSGVDPSILVLLRFTAMKRGNYAVRGADSSD